MKFGVIIIEAIGSLQAFSGVTVPWDDDSKMRLFLFLF